MSDDLVGRLKRAEGIGACLSGDAHHVKNLCSEAASAIEAKDAESKRLRGKLDVSISNSKLLLDAKNYWMDRAMQAERELDVANANHRQMSKQMADLGRALAEATTIIKLGLDVVSEERGWGTYPRMEGSEIYDDANAFSGAARQFVKEHGSDASHRSGVK